jgi:hypothetical protein
MRSTPSSNQTFSTNVACFTRPSSAVLLFGQPVQAAVEPACSSMKWQAPPRAAAGWSMGYGLGKNTAVDKIPDNRGGQAAGAPTRRHGARDLLRATARHRGAADPPAIPDTGALRGTCSRSSPAPTPPATRWRRG